METKLSFGPGLRCRQAGRQAGSLRPSEADVPQKHLCLVKSLISIKAFQIKF